MGENCENKNSLRFERSKLKKNLLSQSAKQDFFLI